MRSPVWEKQVGMVFVDIVFETCMVMLVCVYSVRWIVSP